MSSSRAGAYALLAISLINMVYQHTSNAILIRSTITAVIALLMLLFTLTKVFRQNLLRSNIRQLWWALIVIGIILALI